MVSVRLLRYLLVACVVTFVAHASAAPLMELVTSIALPGVKGRIDHLSADPAKHRLFVAALGNNTVEVLDTRTSERRTISGFAEPQGVLYLASLDRLLIANGGGNRVDLVDMASMSTVQRLDAMDDADNIRYDRRTRRIWVGYGKGSLRIFDPASGQVAGDIAVEGHPESFQLEQEGPRAFVNVPSARSVVVVDRAKQAVVARWPTTEVSANFPMALDERSARLFVGARSPPTMLVYDTGSGNIVARLPIGKDADDLFFDGARKRIYVICGEGRIDVFQQVAADRYVMRESIETAPRARTGLFVPEEESLYVAAPASNRSPARIFVYRVH